MGKENESTECQQNLPEPPLSIVPAASSSFNSHVPNWNFSSQCQYSAPFNSQGSYPMASTHTVYHPNHYTMYQPNQMVYTPVPQYPNHGNMHPFNPMAQNMVPFNSGFYQYNMNGSYSGYGNNQVYDARLMQYPQMPNVFHNGFNTFGQGAHYGFNCSSYY